MDNPNPIYYRDLITPDDSITKLMEQLDELIAKYDGAKQKIQGAAAEISKGLQNVAGASEEQRKAIQLATEQSEKLVTEYRDITTASWKATQAFAEAAAAKKESAQIDKLITQINTSAEGSYNRLSAQYRLNKIRLNEMSAAERQASDAGRALEAETAAIYEEMKRLQEATGKHQLNVGNYADAAKGLKTELMSLTQQMAFMKTQGQGNSEEYKQMAARAGQLKDAMMDANREVKAMASDTQAMDAVMGAAGAASGGLSVVTGATALFGAKSESAAETQRKLGSAIAIVSGVTAIQNALQKESNLMTGIRILQTKAATKAEALDAATKGKNVVATTAATVAQKAFNAVANANPYLLLATALLTVVGALAAFTAGAKEATKAQERLNTVQMADLDYTEIRAKNETRAYNERINQLENELKVAKANNATKQETQAIEDEIYNERVKAFKRMESIYRGEINNLDENRKKLEELQYLLWSMKSTQAAGGETVTVYIDGEFKEFDVNKDMDAIQGQVDALGRKVQIGAELVMEGQNIQTERDVQLAERQNKKRSGAARDRAKIELDAQRQLEDAKIALIANGYERDTTMARTQTARKIEDIRTRLKKEKDLTTKARKALNDQIEFLELQLQQQLNDIQNEYAQKNLDAIRETEDVQLALMSDGAEKQRKQLELSYNRQIEDLQNALVTQRDLSETEVEQMNARLLLLREQYAKDLAKLNAEISMDQLDAEIARIDLQLETVKEGSQEYIDLTLQSLAKKRQIELIANTQVAEDVRQSEADINAKWDAIILQQTAELTSKRATMLLEAQQELAASEFELLNRNERQKTQFQLQQEKERLQQLLELDAQNGNQMTEQERKTMENTIKAIDKQAKGLPYNNMYELLGIGLDSEQQGAVNTAIDSVKESVASLIDSWNKAADAAVNAANAQVDAAQRTLDAEIEARNAGYANEVSTAQKELELAKKNQEKALKEKEKAQKAQLALDSITQASSLVTASAQIWSALGGIPYVGPALAVAAIATMWGTFIAAKIKAAQLSKSTEQYADGTVELLQGGSHASGHDIDLGTKPDGTRRRAEGGEFFAVINKRNSRRFGHIIPDVINSFNDGTFADKYQRASEAMAGYAVGMFGTDVTGLERDVAAIRQQGDESRYVDGQGNTIIRYRNLTRKIKS